MHASLCRFLTCLVAQCRHWRAGRLAVDLDGQPLRARQPHGATCVVFDGLDQIDQAIGDVAATSAALDEIISTMNDGDAKHEDGWYLV